VSVDDARQVVERAVAACVFPAAAIEVGRGAGPIWSDARGALTFDAGAPATSLDTLFDLASLTKPIATTTAAMDLVRRGTLSLDALVADFFDDWRGRDRERVTVRDLLEHASGLAARLVDRPPATRREFEHEICTMPLEYEPRTKSIYSDLGFILLGFMVRLKPDATYGTVRGVRLQADLMFGLPPDQRADAAPTLPMKGDPRRGRRLVGEVHDNYAAALGGVAGHAGLFGTAAAVGAFARATLQAVRNDEPLIRMFTTKTTVPGSSRALGWDTMLPTSSCGTRMSAEAFGHVGFTGTSLWIDPVRDRYFVLLTNRVCGGGTLDDMRTVRRAFHDALGDI
jgi:CubicO group peptidase (beta-lactamase class C family)